MHSSFEESLRALVRDAVREELRAHGIGPNPAATAPLASSPAYVSTQQAAQIAGVHAATIRDWIRRGLLHGHRAGRLLRIDREELVTMMSRTAALPSSSTDLDARAEEILGRRRSRR